MIVVVTTSAHRDTHKVLRQQAGLRLQRWTYQRLLRAARLPRACYIFTDFDRLSFWELELASLVFRQLRAQGVQVLNDPARVRQRFGLLRHLHATGLNSFNVWRVEDGEQPERFPVFLRQEAAHRGTLSDLLHDQAAVDQAVAQALAEGYPRRDLMLVEYCAEPDAAGIFRKFAIYRVGDHIVPALSVNDTAWHVKYGQAGAGGSDWYRQELELTRENRFAELLRPYFEAAEIEYGRADFTFSGGQPQLFEINTNPMLARLRSHESEDRLQSAELVWHALGEAFRSLDPGDSAGSRAVPMDHPVLQRQRRKDRWMTRPRWMR